MIVIEILPVEDPSEGAPAGSGPPDPREMARRLRDTQVEKELEVLKRRMGLK
jgi:hypothetical protein